MSASSRQDGFRLTAASSRSPVNRSLTLWPPQTKRHSSLLSGSAGQHVWAWLWSSRTVTPFMSWVGGGKTEMLGLGSVCLASEPRCLTAHLLILLQAPLCATVTRGHGYPDGCGVFVLWLPGARRLTLLSFGGTASAFKRPRAPSLGRGFVVMACL